MIHAVQKNSTNHRATQIPHSTTHKYFRKTADITVHISCQILKCGAYYGNSHSLNLKRQKAFTYKQSNFCLICIHNRKAGSSLQHNVENYFKAWSKEKIPNNNFNITRTMDSNFFFSKLWLFQNFVKNCDLCLFFLLFNNNLNDYLKLIGSIKS
jgi:hypothetical protein